MTGLLGLLGFAVSDSWVVRHGRMRLHHARKGLGAFCLVPGGRARCKPRGLCPVGVRGLAQHFCPASVCPPCIAGQSNLALKGTRRLVRGLCFGFFQASGFCGSSVSGAPLSFTLGYYGTRMKSPLVELTETILQQLPPSSRFGEEDAALVLCHQPLLLALEADLVQGFYDTIYAHAPLRAVMSADDRLAREATLRQWWQRTVTGPFDERYWTWQVLVGLVHVKRGVKNPMMMGMWGFLLTWLRGRLAASVGESEAIRVMGSFERLAVTVQALTSESYLEHYLKVLQRTTGFKPALLERLVHSEIDQLLVETRAAWDETK